MQRAIVAGLIIPTPDVAVITELEAFERLYPPDFKMPRQLIHVQRKEDLKFAINLI